MNCWNCGTANDAAARFCIQCGAPQARTCPVCRHENPAGARFCANCGSPMTDAAASVPVSAPAASTPVAERRLVSVLFVDLVGFTSASEGRDPEETRELLSHYFELARGTVERHGGTIEKFIGDAVMAVWGAPTAHEDDAERAVRAALELVGAVAQITDDKVALRARAGVLTGEAAVTIGAEGQGMVAGDLVNTASRLQGAAEPGTVLVGEATYRAASNAIKFEPAGEHLFKGKASPMAAWRPIAVVARRGGSGRASTLEPPFVGREDELRQLKDLFTATGRESKPRLVTVIGQAGIGKSRLAWEFEKYLDGVVDPAYWHEGRSPAYGEGVSYWALAEMVRRRSGIADGDEAGEARKKLVAMLEEFVPDAGERRWIEPRLSGLLGLAELPSEGREELFSAWRTLFVRIAERAPVIMVFTDLQWADQGLIDFIEDLLGWARSSPILVLALARPELSERRPDFGATVRSVTRINLEPLSDEQMGTLLSGLLPGLERSALEGIVERAEGIPLYAVETVRMLLDTGAVVEEDGHYRPQGDLSQLAVAETLHALIASRLDAALPEDRALLQDASVLGQSFTVESLAAVSGTAGAALEAQLDRLVRRQLLIRDVDPRSPERGQYRFVQSLVREVAYQTLAREDRRTRHLAAARFFEALGEEELAGILASHYLAAHQASRPGPEADALAAQARVSLLGAVERAVALHSYRQAIAYLQQALIVTTNPAERADIHERIARAGEPTGDLVLAVEHAAQARETYRQVGDGRGALRAATWIGRSHVMSQREADAIEVLGEAIAEAAGSGDPELALAHAELARAYMLADRHREAVEAADRALQVADASPFSVIEALITKGTSLTVIGRTIEGETTLRGAMHLADRHGLIAASLRARNNLSGPLTHISMPESEAIDREGYEMSSRLGHRPFRHQFLYNLLEKGWRRGDWDAWRAEADETMESDNPSPYYQSGYIGYRAVRSAIRGDSAAAKAQLAETSAVVAHLTSATIEVFPNLIAAWIQLAECRWDEAVREARIAAHNTNFTMDAWAITTLSAAAGNLDEAGREAMDFYARPMWPGPVAAAMLQFATGVAEIRHGTVGHTEPSMAGAVQGLIENEDMLVAHVAGLTWSRLLPDSAAARAAGEAAAAFFGERGASSFVDRFDAGFVRGGAESPGASSLERAARSDG